MQEKHAQKAARFSRAQTAANARDGTAKKRGADAGQTDGKTARERTEKAPPRRGCFRHFDGLGDGLLDGLALLAFLLDRTLL